MNEKNNKYPEWIMRQVRQSLGLEPSDTSKDVGINGLNKANVLGFVSNWNGLINYSSTIIGWIEDIYGISLQDFEEK